MEPRRAFLKDNEAVAYLHERGIDLSPATMKNWRSNGKSGLKFHKIGGKIYYLVCDLEDWLNHNRFAEGGRRCPRPMTPAAPAEITAPHQQVHGGPSKVPVGGARGALVEAIAASPRSI